MTATTIPTIIRTDDDAWLLMATAACDRLDAQRLVDGLIDDPRKRDRSAPVVRLEDRPPPGLVWQARPDCSIPVLRDGGAYAREQQQIALAHVDALATALNIRVIDLRTASPRGAL